MTTHYADFLKQRLQERISANPRYSLRAFARDLGLNASKLSEVLNRKQGLSAESARRICRKLSLSPSETEYFCKLVEASDARSKRARLAAQAQIASLAEDQSLRQIQDDTFKIISDWYHYALLSLAETLSFKSDAAWIARRLGITKLEVEQAVSRLARLELLEIKGGKIRPTGVQLTTKSGMPSESIRKFNRQVIEKSLQAIAMQTIDEREIGTLTTSVHTDDLPVIKEMIRRHRRELNQFIMTRNKSRKPNEVYCLAAQFFRLTSRFEKNKENV